MSNLVIVDYEVGNISSLTNALLKLKIDHIVTDKIKKIEAANIIILPGVGSFDKAMSMIKKKNILRSLEKCKNQNKKIIGICVGMQILATLGYENKITKGLNFIEGNVKKINKSKNYRLPVMNWYEVKSNKKDDLKINNKIFYFLHSYSFNCKNKADLFYYCNSHNTKIPAVINKGNVYGIQFHPEKSGKNGLSLLQKIITGS